MAASNSPSATSNSQERETSIVSPASSSATERPARRVALSSLRGDKEFRKVRTHGVALRDPLFTLRLTEYRPRYGETWRPRALVGIVVPKKTLKRAVDRNRARRRLREALRTLPDGLPPCRAILMPNPAVLKTDFADLQTALARAFARAPKQVGGRNKAKAGNQKGNDRVMPSVTTAQTDPSGLTK